MENITFLASYGIIECFWFNLIYYSVIFFTNNIISKNLYVKTINIRMVGTHERETEMSMTLGIEEHKGK
jgi:hypothetical protein